MTERMTPHEAGGRVEELLRDLIATGPSNLRLTVEQWDACRNHLREWLLGGLLSELERTQERLAYAEVVAETADHLCMCFETGLYLNMPHDAGIVQDIRREIDAWRAETATP